MMVNVSTSLITGSFVKAEDYRDDREAYQDLLDEMKSLNLNIVIVERIGTISCSGETERTVSNDTIGWMLEDAGSQGMRVYVGMYWNEHKNDTRCNFWEDQRTPTICNSVQAVEEIEKLYGSHPALQGYYVVQEAYVGDHDIYLINQFYTPLISMVHSASYGKPVIAGGFMIPGGRSPEVIREWVSRFKENGLDIFLLQDGVGGFDNSMTASPTIYDYFVAAREALSPKPIWTVVEVFQWSGTKIHDPSDNWYRPANAMRINQQIYFANAAGAEEKIAWINQHHMSLVGKNAHGTEARHLYRGYRALYFTGQYYDNPSYRCNPQPSPQYPDRGGMLFDNTEGQSGWAEWVGFERAASPEVKITVDLGEIKPVSDVTAVVRSEPKVGISYPARIMVEVSKDGKTYNLLGSMENPYADYADNPGEGEPVYSKAYLWVSATALQEARYVKITLTHRSYWLFISELEVYGS